MKGSIDRESTEQDTRTSGNLLNVDHLAPQLKSRTVRGAAAIAASQIVRFSTRIVTIAILARLLSPNDFGLYAMVTTIVGLMSTIKDMGLTSAVVQRAEITNQEASNLFWLNVLFGAALGIGLVLLSPAASKFFQDERLILVCTMLAVIFLIDALGTQHQAILRRRMEFNNLLIIEVTALTLGAVVAITLGFVLKSYWALVAIPLSNSFIMCMALWCRLRWRPSLPKLNVSIRPYITFGGHVMAVNVLNYLFRNLDNILIGRYLGAISLGIYSNAYALLMMPLNQINGPISSVALPALSRLLDNHHEYRKYYCRGLSFVVTVGMPIVSFVYADAENIVQLVLGSQWNSVVEIFRALGPAAFIGTFSVATSWVYLSTGRVTRLLIAGLVNSTITAIAFSIGIKNGILGVAAALSISMMLTRLPSILFCYRGTPIALLDFIRSVWRPALASVSAGILLVNIKHLLELNSLLIVQVAIDGALFLGAYFLLLALLPNGRVFIKQFVGITRYLKGDS